MPELPDVETVLRGIAPRVEARVVRSVQLRVPALRWPLPAHLPAQLPGARVMGASRRGKYLLLEFAAGWVIVHLGMSGTLRWVAPDVALRPHDHADLVFDEGILRLNDPRRFGALLWHDRTAGPIGAHPLLVRLGLEPMQGTVQAMAAALYRESRGRQVSIKALLLAGAIVVGVGNIYASESLHRARIHPGTPGGRISLQRYERLAYAIRATLDEAIQHGGSTLRDFVASDGSSGYFQIDALVYDRAGQPCRRCQGQIRRIVQQQRATYFCPACQH
jgi:formamidopyrimidine-DNA glycosylase